MKKSNQDGIDHMANEYMAHITDRLSVTDSAPETVTFSVRCQPWLAQRLKTIAEHTGVTRNCLVTDLLIQAHADFVRSLEEECKANGVEDAISGLLKALEEESRLAQEADSK